MAASRLQRSYNAQLRTRDDIAAFCEKNAIPNNTKYHAITQPTEETRRDFADAYAIDAFPPVDLLEEGSSAIIVFEKAANEKHHGEMVTAVADRVANNLMPLIESIYVGANINTAHREWFDQKLVQPVSDLVANQGVAVMHTSIGWNDNSLSFTDDLDRQMEEMWNVTAFVVDSTGNEGELNLNLNRIEPFQKNNAVSHAPPLVVHVGAAARDTDGTWKVEGYSSANSPTLLAPVAPDKKAIWDDKIGPEELTGTSIAAPYVSGVLSALNKRFGAYLTREQILYAVFATCEKVERVSKFPKNLDSAQYILQTPKEKELTYTTNQAGLSYNAEYAGFGLIQPHAAFRLLAQMVALTQAKPESITVPVEERVKREISTSEQPARDMQGRYVYTVRMPEGVALKTTLAAEFKERHGSITLVSPSGTRLPLVMSRLPGKMGWADPAAPKFGISTTHGWAGESLAGEWRIESTEPLKTLQMNQHHFLAQDIVQSLDVPALLKKPLPALNHARPLIEITHNLDWRTHADLQYNGIENFGATVAQLRQLPSAFNARHRIYTPLDQVPDTHPARLEETKATMAKGIDASVEHYLRAADLYATDNMPLHRAAALESAAWRLQAYIAPFNDDANTPTQQAAALLAQAIQLQKQSGAIDRAYSSSCKLYHAHCTILQHADAIGDSVRAEQERVTLGSLRDDARALWNQCYGGSDPAAHRIEQGEMGFSASVPIGTDNVGQCLIIMARDPATHKTGLVHLDNEVDTRTLDRFFERFPPQRLDVRLVGAHNPKDQHSQQNIASVMRYLSGKNINIISTDILAGINGPAAMVVDPLDFSVRERVPTLSTINAAIGNAVLLFTQGGKPLDLQFDFTRSDAYAPILLGKEALQALRKDYLGKDEAAIEQHFARQNFIDRPLMVDHLLTLMDAYAKEWSALNTTLTTTLAAQHADAVTTRRAQEALRAQPFYVGEHAEAANQPIHAWLREQLLINGTLQHTALQQGPQLDARPQRLTFTDRAMAQTQTGGAQRQ